MTIGISSILAILLLYSATESMQGFYHSSYLKGKQILFKSKNLVLNSQTSTSLASGINEESYPNSLVSVNGSVFLPFLGAESVQHTIAHQQQGVNIRENLISSNSKGIDGSSQQNRRPRIVFSPAAISLNNRNQSWDWWKKRKISEERLKMSIQSNMVSRYEYLF